MSASCHRANVVPSAQAILQSGCGADWKGWVVWDRGERATALKNSFLFAHSA
jgi:hypothetical protein